MKLGNLVEILKGIDESLDVVVDADDNGFYYLSGVNTKEIDGEKFVNIVSSNES